MSDEQSNIGRGAIMNNTVKKIVGFLFVAVLGVFVMVGAAMAGMDIPDKLKDVPLYSGTKIVQVMDMDKHAVAVLTVKADRDALVDFYKQSMKTAGWKLAFQAEQEDGAVLHFTKEDHSLQVSVQKGDEDGTINYQLAAISQ